MTLWDAKAGDLVVLPAYRSDPGLVVLSKPEDQNGIVERPVLVKYLDGTLIKPRYFDAVQLKARNVKFKPFRDYANRYWRHLFAGLNGMFGVFYEY
ncbi:toxin-antitoxin system toxin subunit [Escherichia coli]|nr:toxin-antitoxin system toxin subunit [Escherichia coli]ELQ7540818.1 toxin-antitoxin system toxin subunit [Escherichia coli]MDK6461238.1 toxin-antitoxin system toxin subunit [Escherichia coli]HAJ7191240.1 toxin-antitoxin system toxin subunit [Escherichia coli]